MSRTYEWRYSRRINQRSLRSLPTLFPPCPSTSPCLNPLITLDDLPDSTGCGDEVSGRVTCNGIPLKNIKVTLTSSSSFVQFDGTGANSILTDANGRFTAPFRITEGPAELPVTFTASATVNRVTAGASISTAVSCDCPCRLSVNITRENFTIQGLGVGTLTFRGSFCNNCANSNNFVISFSPNQGSSISCPEGNFIACSFLCSETQVVVEDPSIIKLTYNKIGNTLTVENLSCRFFPAVTISDVSGAEIVISHCP